MRESAAEYNDRIAHEEYSSGLLHDLRRWRIAINDPARLLWFSDSRCEQCHGAGYKLAEADPDMLALYTVISDQSGHCWKYRAGDRIPCPCTAADALAAREIAELEEMAIWNAT